MPGQTCVPTPICLVCLGLTMQDTLPHLPGLWSGVLTCHGQGYLGTGKWPEEQPGSQLRWGPQEPEPDLEEGGLAGAKALGPP